MSERAVIHSYGGGVQSAAIAVLVARGSLPVPERVVMADTGREASLTWRYLAEYVQPLYARVSRRVEIAPHSLSAVDLFAKGGDKRPLIPLYNSHGGRIDNLCSVEWKRRVVGRWLRKQGFGPQRPVREWLGISTDEVHRAKPGATAWRENHYPLLYDVPMSRVEASLLVQSEGLPAPPRSSCWMCPFRSDAEWRALRDRQDGDWQRAVTLDGELREIHDGRGQHFVHRSMRPLSDAALKGDGQGELDLCEEGRCEF